MYAGLKRGLNTGFAVPACLLEKYVPWLSPAMLIHLQRARLRRIVKHAWEHVPFYRASMMDAGIGPADIRTAEDLSLLPMVSNEDLRKDPFLLNSDTTDYENDLLIRAGNYKNVYWSKRAALQWFCRLTRFRTVINSVLNQSSGYVEAYLHPETSCNQKLNAYWKRHLLHTGRGGGRFRLDIGDPYEETCRKINELKPDIVYCYGSQTEQFLKYVHSRGLEFRAPRVWIYGSDYMSPETRLFIEETFGCLVFSVYSMNEMGAFGFQCEKREGFHLNIDACAARIVDSDGRTVPDGTAGEVVISNLVNRSTVILNYRTGDRARFSRDFCSCGRALPLLKDLLGRVCDILHCANGRNVSFGVLDSMLGTWMDPVSSYQVVQDRPGHLRWQLVPLPGADKAEIAFHLDKATRSLAPYPNQVEISWVEKPEVTAGNKRKFVIHRFKK